jgi:hypothetical protein
MLIGAHVKGLLFFFQSLMKIELYPQILGKYSNIKFLENPSFGIRAVPCGLWDSWNRHYEANSHFAKLCEQSY